VGVREAVSDALATLYSVAEICSRRERDGQLANGDADTNTVLEAIGGVPDATRAAIEAAGLPPDTEGMARATLELWPIFDHISMTQELAILARLGRHVASAYAGAGEVCAQGCGLNQHKIQRPNHIPPPPHLCYQAAIADLVPGLQALLTGALPQSSRAPADAAPYMRLLWLAGGLGPLGPAAKGMRRRQACRAAWPPRGACRHRHGMLPT
jgi:hypothetical protein